MNAVEAWREMLKADQLLLWARHSPTASYALIQDAEKESREAHAALTGELRRANSGRILPTQCVPAA